MPKTRASTRRLTSKRKLSEDTATGDDSLDNTVRHVHNDTEAETRMSIMDNLREARSGVEKLHAQIRYLEQENERLKSELLRAQQTVSTDAARGVGSRERASRRQIRSLEQKITDLNAAREKDRRIIEKLREKEVERDAEELAADHAEVASTQQTVDLGESAIKLLRHMCNTIDMNTLAEAEECAICMEEMTVGMCYSLPCEHPVCVGCFGRLGDGSTMSSDTQTGSIQCPHCRKVCPRDECEIITHTAEQQWDLLLDISQEWTAKDAEETDIGQDDDDDDDDGFIDDGSVAAAKRSAKTTAERFRFSMTFSPCPPETLADAAGLDPEVSTTSTSPSDTRPVTYKSLPSPMKRKRLTELAAQRVVKQRV